MDTVAIEMMSQAYKCVTISIKHGTLLAEENQKEKKC